MTVSVAWSGRVAALEPQLLVPSGSSGNQTISNLDKSGRIPMNSPLKYPFIICPLGFVDDFSINLPFLSIFHMDPLAIPSHV